MRTFVCVGGVDGIRFDADLAEKIEAPRRGGGENETGRGLWRWHRAQIT
jgi:hypothetical protein